MRTIEDFVADQFAFRHAIAISRLHCPQDIRQASQNHGANCGPASYAAMFERNVSDVISRFPQFPKRRYTTASQMERALEQDTVSFRRLMGEMPQDGVALLQFEGPWGDETTNTSAALKRTHWVAVKGELVYDINWGSWLPLLAWETLIYPKFVEFEPRISGWSIRCSFETVREMPSLLVISESEFFLAPSFAI